jgi:hypothetical protein
MSLQITNFVLASMTVPISLADIPIVHLHSAAQLPPEGQMDVARTHLTFPHTQTIMYHSEKSLKWMVEMHAFNSDNVLLDTFVYWEPIEGIINRGDAPQDVWWEHWDGRTLAQMFPNLTSYIQGQDSKLVRFEAQMGWSFEFWLKDYWCEHALWEEYFWGNLPFDDGFTLARPAGSGADLDYGAQAGRAVELHVNDDSSIPRFIWGYEVSDRVSVIVDVFNPGAPPDPVPAFTFTPVKGPIPLTVHFTDLSSPGVSSQHIVAWHWEFGDGYTSDEQNPTHIYTFSGALHGIFYPRLTVTTAWPKSASIQSPTPVEGTTLPCTPSIIETYFPAEIYPGQQFMPVIWVKNLGTSGRYYMDMTWGEKTRRVDEQGISELGTVNWRLYYTPESLFQQEFTKTIAIGMIFKTGPVGGEPTSIWSFTTIVRVAEDGDGDGDEDGDGDGTTPPEEGFPWKIVLPVAAVGIGAILLTSGQKPKR